MFNTLALGETVQTYTKSDIILLFGDGTSKESMKKSPKKKFITQRMILSLIDLAKEEGNEKFIKSYWNTYYCFDRIKTDGNRAYGNYCKNRFCLVCSTNRKANLINKYRPILEEWEKPYFLTLTRKSFKVNELYKGVRQTKLHFQSIIKRCQKRHSRGKGVKIECIVSMECNYNPIEKTYNPHFHIITKSKEIGVLLNVEWLKTLGKTNANYQAQKLTEIEDKEAKLVEVIKYCTKVFTDPEMKQKKNQINDPHIYIAAIHEINKAFDGLQVFNTYGFKLLNNPKEKRTIEKLLNEIKEWDYVPSVRSYVELTTGEVMHPEKYLPDAKIEYLLKENIDIIEK